MYIYIYMFVSASTICLFAISGSPSCGVLTCRASRRLSRVIPCSIAVDFALMPGSRIFSLSSLIALVPVLPFATWGQDMPRPPAPKENVCVSAQSRDHHSTHLNRLLERGQPSFNSMESCKSVVAVVHKSGEAVSKGLSKAFPCTSCA